MAGVADSAVGAILEIPPTALQNIEKAEKAIQSLANTSLSAANSVKTHWGNIAVDGLQTFIEKINAARQAMNGLGTVNVTLNTREAIKSSQQLSEQVKKTEMDVSQAAQTAAASWNALSKVSLSNFDITNYGNNLTEVGAKLETLKKNLKNEPVGSGQNQAMADEIRQIEEWIRLYKQATEEKNKALGNVQQKQQAKTDKAYLDEQKRLLERILQLRKDIAGLSISVQRGTITGKSDMSAELAQLEQLRKELREAGRAYRDLQTFKKQDISDAAKEQALNQAQKAKTAGLRQELEERNKLNAAITRANELTAQGQQGKTRLGSGEEAAIQRQLNSDYKGMLKIIREQAEIKAKAAEQGRRLTQQEITLITTLAQRYKVYYDDVQRVTNAYAKMGEAAAKNFAADRSEQMARNAIALADARRKATEAAQKEAEALQRAADAKSAQDRKQAETDLNRLYTERLRLLKEKDALEQKDLLNTAKGQQVTLTQKEVQLLGEITNKLRQNEAAINAVGNMYSGLAAKAKHAYALEELRQAVQMQNKFNREIDAIDTSKAQRLAAEYKKLYQENQRLVQSMRAYFNNGGNAVSASIGTQPQDVAYQQISQRRQEVSTRMAEIERQNIQDVVNFRAQKEMEANQKSISDFVQAEAQKKAAALQSAQEQSAARIQAYQQYLNSYNGAMAAANKLGTRGGNYEDTYENRARVIQNLENAIRNLNKADSDYAAKLGDLTSKLRELKNAQKEVNDAMKSQPKITVADAEQAYRVANATRTLEAYESAYKKLLAVMRETPRGAAWDSMNAKAKEIKHNIDGITKKMREFKSESQKTTSSLNGLKGQIMATFSLGAIYGFLKHMTEIRAQFELQRVALGAILQDQDRANKVFTDIQQMALQSPFTIMQLERATKQIAAFGFEADQLKPTLKMLADLSAGLGVEIDRLVLVMGHMKARNYLEGTMVRQFSNAGFNVLDELAKYYTEIEGRMVSVAEVQERVKKKMVEFGDVEEVLKRVTSAGGMFYDMQRKQSDSIYGQMQRITDAYDLMLNQIGKDNEGAIKSVLTWIRELINNWRKVAPVLKHIGGMMIAMFAFKGIRSFIVSMNQIGKSIVALRNAYGGVKVEAEGAAAAANATKLAVRSTSIGAAVVILGTIASYLWGCKEAAEALNKEMERIGQESAEQLGDALFEFERLAKVISDSSKPYTERAEAMEEVKRAYGEILPEYALEMDYIIGLKGEYGELTNAISEYYQKKEYEKKLDAIKESDEAKEVGEELDTLLQEMNREGKLSYVLSKGQVKTWADTIAEELLSGKIPASINALEERIKEVFGEDIDISEYTEGDISGQIDLTDVLQAYEEVEKAKGNIALATANVKTAEEGLAGSFAQVSQQYDTLVQQSILLEKAIQGDKEAMQKLAEIDMENWSALEGLKQLFTGEIFESKNYQAQLDAVNKSLEKLAEAKAKAAEDELIKSTQEQTDALNAEITAYVKVVMEMKSLEAQSKETSDKYKELKDKADNLSKSLEGLAYKYGTEIPWAELKTIETTQDLNLLLETITTKIMPGFRQAVSSGFTAACDAIMAKIRETMPELANFTSGLNDIITMALHGFTSLGGSIWDSIKSHFSGEDVIEYTLPDFYNESVKKRTKQFKADMNEINKLMSDYKGTAEETAKELIDKANDWEAQIKAFNTSTMREQRMRALGITEKDLSIMERNAKAARAIAKDLMGDTEKSSKSSRNSSKRSGEDPIKKLWENRLDALERYRQAAEKNRQYHSEDVTYNVQNKSFEDLWKQLGLDKIQGLSLNELLAKGFDPKEIQGDFVDALKIIEKIIPPKYADIIQKVREKIASETSEIGYKQAEREIKDVIEPFYDKYFDLYELTKTVSDIGVPTDILKSIGEYAVTLDDLRYVVDSWGEKKDTMSLKELESFEKYSNKLKDLEQKRDIERLKNFTKYFLESLDERTQIEIKALRDIQKIRDDDMLDQFSKDQAISQRKKQMQEELVKYDFNQFKGSDVYLSVFKDLERASKEQLQYVIDKLKELQSVNKDLSPTQVKAMAQELKKAEAALGKQTAIKDFFPNLSTAVKYFKERNALLEKQVTLQKQIDANNLEITEEEKNLNDLVIERAKISKAEQPEAWEEANKKVEEQEIKLSTLKGLAKKYGYELKKTTDSIDDGNQAWENIKGAIDQVWEKAEQLKSSLDAVFEGLDSMGLVSDGFRDTYESLGDVFNGLGTIKEGLSEINFTAPFSIIKGGLKAIGGIFQTIGGFFGMGDKAKQRKIEKLKEKVEDLTRAYEKLGKAIEDAFTFDEYNAGYKQAMDNLEKQRKATEEMLALEESKKKKDKEAVKEYEQQLEELAEKEEELYKQRIEAQGSTTEYLSAAEGYVSAWLEAYRETGDGLEALKDNWDDFIEGLFTKQAAAQIVSARLKDVIDTINQAIDSGATDFALADVVNDAKEKWAEQAALIEPLLEQLFGAYGLDKGGEFILSDLQKGIQNITEPQAAAIEAYLNSMRFAVFRHTEQLDTLIAAVSAQYGVGVENPVVTELKGIRSVLDSIDRRLGSVIDSRGTSSAFRVV